eukprot:TRINITY_DN77304_c0_g1_i1.p1 TRINITY_DN77304_c0_g1~~TRINITY_DN77304_c0_g1_i1.p1  ORF type:complete len:851 (-),score=214.62 TRINITY_DN77304_c0_g1_i1:47-2566(-)
MLRPTEEEAQICEYLSPGLTGFTGRFKSRWQDFHVHEVDAAGVELHLSELLTPGAVAAEMKKASAERREARAALGPSFALEAEVEVELQETLGKKVLGELVDFLRKQKPKGESSNNAIVEDAAGEEGADSSIVEPPGFVDFDTAAIGDGSKEARKKAHKAVLKHLGTLLNTETVEGQDDTRTVRIWMREAEKRAKGPCGSAAAEPSAATGESKGGKGKGGKSKGKGKGSKKGGKGDRNRKGKAPQSCEEEAEGSIASCSDFGTLRREGWPKDRPDYLYFRLYKENCDTGEAVANIARCVGRSAKQFTVAGTKDRRASTVQQVCAHRLPADQLRRTVLHRLWDKRVRISNLEYRSDRLRLGVLRGNRFRVVLRDVPAAVLSSAVSTETSTGAGPASISNPILGPAFAAVAAGGFLNYFGLQRFGTREVRTHSIGAAIIAGHWQEAVRMILGGPSSSTNPTKTGHLAGQKRAAENSEIGLPAVKVARTSVEPSDAAKTDEGQGPEAERQGKAAGKSSGKARWQQIKEAQEIFMETGDAQQALDAMPKSQHLERCILGALARGLDNAAALSQLPHQSVALYAHGAQSLLWNALLSRRIREFGRQPVVGDLVLADSEADAVHDIGLFDEEEVGAGLEGEAEAEAEPDEDKSHRLPAVRALKSPEEAATKKLSDVFLPLPGSQVQYPPNLRAAYEELSQSLLGLSLADFGDSSLVTLTGSYRPIVVCPADLEWQAVSPEKLRTSGAAALIETDVARLLRERPPMEAAPSVNASETEANESKAEQAPQVPSTEDESKADVEMTQSEAAAETGAVIFSCVLPPSAYLTMLLREVMKQSTASPDLGS